MSDFKRKLTTDITEEQYQELQEILDHGEQKRLISSLINAVIKVHKKFGKIAIYAIISGNLDVLKLSELDGKVKEVGDG